MRQQQLLFSCSAPLPIMNNRVLLGEFLEVVIILNQQKAAGGFRLVSAKKNCLIHDVRK